MKRLQLDKPHMIIMIGIRGAGKTYFAKKFAETFGLPLVSQPQIAKELFRTGANTPSKQMAAKKVAGLVEAEIFKTESSFVCDGNFSQAKDRKQLAEKAKAKGYEQILLWVQTESATAKSRATARHSGLTASEFDKSLQRFVPPSEKENYIVISGKHTFASQLRIVLKKLTEARSKKLGIRRNPGRRVSIR